MALINGKDKETIRKELSEEFPEKELKYVEEINVTCLSVDAVRKRLDSVLGYNYTEDYECSTELLPDKGDTLYPFVTVKCTITIYDDDGNVVTRKSRYGGERIIRTAKGERLGSIVDIGNDVDSACSDAFKRCARLYGVTSSKVGKGNHLGNCNTKDKEDVYSITYLTEFAAVGGTGGYSATVTVEGVGDVSLVVWSDASDSFSKCYGAEWYKNNYSGKKGKVRGQLSTYHGKRQLIFKGF